MDSRISTCADKIINICNELKVLFSNDSTFDVYKQKLLGKLQRLSLGLIMEDMREDGMAEAFADALKGKWITTEEGHPIHIGENGKADKGNPYVLEAISGALEKKSATEESRKKYPRKGEMVCESKVEYENHGAVTKDSLGRKVTHFNHDEDTMKVTRQVKVEDAFGKKYKICREPIEHLTVFAAKDVGRGLDVAEKLAEQTGGSVDSWKHVKGIGTVVDKDGNKRRADLHWFESPETGQVGWKIKAFEDEMEDEDRYWIEGEKENGK